MNTRDAIAQLKDIIRDRETFLDKDEPDSVFQEDIDALKIAIATLEKQMPKEPKTGRAAGDEDDEISAEDVW